MGLTTLVEPGGLFLVMDGRGVEVVPLEGLPGLFAVQVLDTVAERAEFEGAVGDDRQRFRSEPLGLRMVTGFLEAFVVKTDLKVPVLRSM